MLNNFLDKLFGDMTHEQMKASYPWIFGWHILLIIALALGCNSGCGGQDDPPNCTSTVNCPSDVDAGSDVDADNDATPDADNTAPDGNTAGSCADYADVPSDGWLCTLDNSPSIDVNGLTFVVEDGACRLRSNSFWCQDPPPASDMLAGEFACTDINGYFVDCWHN